MNKTTVGTSAGAVAVLVFALRFANVPQREKLGDGRPEAAAVAPNASTAEPAEKTPPLEGPWLATRPFFHKEGIPKVQFANGEKVTLSHIRDLERCAAGDPVCKQGLKDYFGIAEGYQTRFIIASVPDPLHTRLALFTDEAIDAIQKAAFDGQWEFATQWLPWRDTADPLEKDPMERRTQRFNVRVQEKQPGLLVFRRAPQPNTSFESSLLFVFVVGETPTAGINGNQFRAARAYMNVLEAGAAEPVHILGPSFSGSFFSLTQLILDENGGQKPQQGRYVVYSGTATNRHYASAFVNRTGVIFHGANEDTQGQKLYFCRVLDELGIRHEQAASLIEGETGFSKGFVHFGKNSSGRDLDPCGTVSPRVLLFPRDISHLRNVYRDAVVASQQGNSAQQAIDFSLKDPDSGEDSVPVFSNSQTPVTQYAIITQLTDEIRRDRIRIVQLAATDVLDSMFLAKVLRKQCPDTRLLIMMPNLLFTQEAQTDSLTGTLA
ncbi:MAG: hypothetical protein JO091_14220, partial [Acidobacteriaceae bacterium]|nr:hypothetical protein [Acidobacteriaceae bacterium]